MAFATTVTVKRAGTQRLAHIPVQIDNISLAVIAASGGAIPNNSYMAYSLMGVPDIQQGDLLIDERVSATDIRTTSGKAEYRVSGNVEIFDQDHLEVMIVRYSEKTP